MTIQTMRNVMSAPMSIMGHQLARPLSTIRFRINQRANIVVARGNRGFADSGDGSSKTDSVKVKKSKRGKVATRPDQRKQLEKLAAEEKAYQEAILAKTGQSSSPSSPSPTNPPSTASSSTPTPARFTPPTPISRDDDYASDVAVPEQITDRMLQRMLLFSGGPVVFGILLFPLFYYIKKVMDIDLPVWAVYIVQTTIFGGGLLGISYGVISTSWDPKREGSLLGWNEFQTNLPLVLERFRKKD